MPTSWNSRVCIALRGLKISRTVQTGKTVCSATPPEKKKQKKRIEKSDECMWSMLEHARHEVVPKFCVAIEAFVFYTHMVLLSIRPLASAV